MFIKKEYNLIGRVVIFFFSLVKVRLFLFFLMSQSDASVFFLIIRGLFFFTAFGFGTCLVHLFYQNVSGIKVTYNFFGKVVSIEKKLSLLIRM